MSKTMNVLNAEGKRPAGKPKCRWEHSTTRKMALEEVGCRDDDGTQLAEDKILCYSHMKTAINLQML
jgi:hypothetical protein